MENTKEIITKVIAEYLDIDAETIASDKAFTDLGLDSLDVMELVMQIEEEVDTKIELSPELTNIDKLAEYIDGKLGDENA